MSSQYSDKVRAPARKSGKQFLKELPRVKLDILIGPLEKSVRIDGKALLPGLVVHHATDKNKSDCIYNITHSSSGLCVLYHVGESMIVPIYWRLAKLNWSSDATTIFLSDAHYRAIVEMSNLTSKQRSDRQENRIAEDVGGKRQPASGSRWGYRRDVTSSAYLIEAKTTINNKYSLVGRDLQYLRKQAYLLGKVPVYVIEFSNSSEVVLIPSSDIEGNQFVRARGTRTKRVKRTTSITTKDANFVSDGGVINVVFPDETYSLICYEQFLEICKKEE